MSNIGMLSLKKTKKAFKYQGYDKIHMNCEKATIGILLNMSLDVILICTFNLQASLPKVHKNNMFTYKYYPQITCQFPFRGTDLNKAVILLIHQAVIYKFIWVRHASLCFRKGIASFPLDSESQFSVVFWTVCHFLYRRQRFKTELCFYCNYSQCIYLF